MTRNPARAAYPVALLAILFWSTVPTAFKLGLRFQEPYSLLLGASLVSFLAVGVILAFRGNWKDLGGLRWKQLGFSALMGFLNPVAYYLVLLHAYEILPAQVAQPLNMIWPIVLVLISIPLLGHQIGWKSVGAMCISFSGVVIISLQGNSAERHPDHLLGIFMALASSVVWAFYFLLNARDGLDPVLRLFVNFFFSSLYLVIGAILFGIPFPGSGKAWASSAYVGCFEMGITFVLWLTAMRRAGKTDKIGNLVYLAPFLNLLIVHWVLGEKIFLTTLAGILLLVTGIVMQNARSNEGG